MKSHRNADPLQMRQENTGVRRVDGTRSWIGSMWNYTDFSFNPILCWWEMIKRCPTHTKTLLHLHVWRLIEVTQAGNECMNNETEPQPTLNIKSASALTGSYKHTAEDKPIQTCCLSETVANFSSTRIGHDIGEYNRMCAHLAHTRTLTFPWCLSSSNPRAHLSRLMILPLPGGL